MFREMTRSERQITNQDAEEILRKGLYGVLSTSGEDGYAYGVPLNYVYQDGKIYIHCALKGLKTDNIHFNDRVSFCVVGNAYTVPEEFTTAFESVIAFGRAEEATGDEKCQALRLFVQKYAPGQLKEGDKFICDYVQYTTVLAVKVEHLTGKNRKE